MAKIKNTEDVPKIKPLAAGIKPRKYDDLVNKVRVECGIPFNYPILTEIALDDYVSKRTTNGKVDVAAIAAPYVKVKAKREIEALKKKIAEKEKTL